MILVYFRSLAARFFHRSQTENDLEEELRSHIQLRADDLERFGLGRAEAERRARIVTTLVKTPGHAPAETLAAAPILNQLQISGGATQVRQQLLEARGKDPRAQLWPEVAVDIIGAGYQRAGDIKNAIEIFKLNLLAYPDSADAHYNLADAYLADGQKELARQYAEKALAMLDSHAAPLSSWSDTEQRRGEIRRSVQKTLKKLSEPQG